MVNNADPDAITIPIRTDLEVLKRDLSIAKKLFKDTGDRIHAQTIARISTEMAPLQRLLSGKGLIKEDFSKKFRFVSDLFGSPNIVENTKAMDTAVKSMANNLGKVTKKETFTSPLGLPKDSPLYTGFKTGDDYFKEIQKSAEKALPRVTDGANVLNSQIKKVTSSLKKNRVEFQGWALSMLFAGQSIKRFFTNLYTQGSKVFNEVAHSVEGTVTGFDMLNGSVQYLWFNIGQALEPVAMLLIPIVDKIADWVSNNQQLVATLTVMGVIFGTLLVTVGSLVLFGAGLLDLFFKLQAVLPAVSAAIAGISAPALIAIGIISAAIIALVIMWQTNWGGMQEFVETVFDAIKKTFESIADRFKVIWNNLTEFFKNVMEGDWRKAFGNLAEIAIQVLGIVWDTVKLLMVSIGNLGRWITNVVIDSITALAKGFLDVTAGSFADFVGLFNEELGQKIEATVDKSKELLGTIGTELKVDYLSIDSLNANPIVSAIDKALSADRGQTTNNIYIDGAMLQSTNTQTWSNLADEVTLTSQRYG